MTAVDLDRIAGDGVGLASVVPGPMAVTDRAMDGDLRRFEARAMASPIRLTLPASVPGDLASAAWTEVRAEFEAAEQAMSRFRETSDLTAVNRAAGDGSFTAVDPRLRRALVAADRARRVTGGRFEPRVIGDLERLGYPGVPIAPSSGRSDASARGGRLVAVSRPARVRLAAPVDLGGIGKGLALRWAAERVRRLLPGHAGALLEAGGDLVATAPRPPSPGADRAEPDRPPVPWLVAIEDPFERTGGPAVVALASGALATSSVRLRRWRDASGTAVHHLVDPTTGRPGGEGLVAVTVAAADPAWAEVRSKQLFLEGHRGIGGSARALGLAAWWITEAGGLEMTPAARQRTVWVEAEAPRSS